uniref:Uncharacterized protein TCIL3000_10_6500 n=1 Tax=Trypanosoma congolense (strain IL3000) TaxID=1068625 RepID=G0UWW0_TRYCI|nr:unnamed protein product [Trypanosoma congolense IL3000]
MQTITSEMWSFRSQLSSFFLPCFILRLKPFLFAREISCIMDTEKFARILHVVYAAGDNEVRRRATEELLQAEEHLSPNEIVSIGTGLFGVTDQGAAVQAYGAVLLRNAVVSNRIAPSMVPYVEIMTWYFEEPTLGQLLCNDIGALLTECMLHEWPESYPDLMARVCPPSARLVDHPRKLRFLSSFVARVAAPHVGGVPVSRMKPLKNAIARCGRSIIIEVIQALFDMYTAAGGAPGSSCAPGTEESVLDCLLIMTHIAPCLPVEEWREVGVTNTLSALVQWRPVAQEALAAATALLRCDRLSGTPGTKELGDGGTVFAVRSELLDAALDSVEMCVTELNYTNIEEIMELLHESPDVLLHPAIPSISRVCLLILSVPSIFLASIACSILRRLGDPAFNHINPLELLMRLTALVPKNKFHPMFGVDERGVKLSEHDYGTCDAFDQGFSEFRSLSAHVLTTVARIYPVVSNQFILVTITNLNDSKGTAADPRTRSGCDSAKRYLQRVGDGAFPYQNLSDSFKYSSEYIPQIIEEMVKREPEDMVIFPVYLNMLSLLWKCRDGTDLGVWQGTMDAILKSLEHQHRVPNDPDALSARKRALTLLITACSKHAANLIPFGEIFVQQLERLLMVPTTSRVERTLLYEAIAAFTAALPTNEAQQRLQKFLDPMAKIMIERVTPMNQNDFNDVIIGRTPAQRDEGYFIHDSLNVVAGVLRRCKAVPYVIETATLLAPAIMRLMKLSHGIYPGDLPPEYASILDPAVESTQFRPTGGWRRGKAAGPRPEVTRARNILMDIRSTLYQVIGMLSSLYPAEPLQDMMQVLVSTAQALSIHTMKQLLLHCVIPVATTQGELLPVALSLCNTFFQHRSLITADRPEGEAKDNRQLFYLSKDILAFIKQNLADNGKLDGNLALSRSVLDVALSILQSGTNISETSHLVTSILQ